jgi:hypothetical protein
MLIVVQYGADPVPFVHGHPLSGSVTYFTNGRSE